jgi:YidC/Oxa1 family membrane protein insertase
MGHFPSVCNPSTPCHYPFLITSFISKGLNLYVLSGITAMLLQTTILQRDVVRRMLRLPVRQKNTDMVPVTFKESIDHLKKWFREQNRIAQERAQQGRKW